jgi:hypothetical protein
MYGRSRCIPRSGRLMDGFLRTRRLLDSSWCLSRSTFYARGFPSNRLAIQPTMKRSTTTTNTGNISRKVLMATSKQRVPGNLVQRPVYELCRSQVKRRAAVTRKKETKGACYEITSSTRAREWPDSHALQTHRGNGPDDYRSICGIGGCVYRACVRGDNARYFLGEGIRALSRITHSMSQDGGTKPKRTWREITEEASREEDPEKLQKLAEELERALDERRKRICPDTDK